MRKLRIGFDIDDTMINAVDTVTGLNNSLYGTQLGRGDWFNNTPEVLERWGLKDAYEVTHRVHELMDRDEYIDAVVEVEGARLVLESLRRKGHELFAVTSRPERIRTATLRELELCFPGIFANASLFMIDAFSGDPKSASVTKLGVAQQLELQHFVDDLPVHANALAEGGIDTILFSDEYLWNQTGASEKTTTLRSWQEVGEYLDAKAQQ